MARSMLQTSQNRNQNKRGTSYRADWEVRTLEKQHDGLVKTPVRNGQYEPVDMGYK